MKTKIRQFIFQILVSLAIVVGAMNVPAKWLDLHKFFLQPHFGTSFTTLSSSDTLANFPTTYNSNLTLTANTSAPNSFTGLQQLTSASTSLLSCFGPCYFGGTATSTFSRAGVLSLASALGVTSGGIGSTTLALGQVLLGSTTNAVYGAGWGTTGQFLTSNGSGVAPTWQTAAVDTTLNYSWTGNHNFTGTTLIKNLNASSTSANPLTLNGLSLNTPSVRPASSTVLSEDGNGNLTWNVQDWQKVAEMQTSVATSSVDLAVPNRKDYLVRFESSVRAASESTDLRLNGDSGTNYGFRYSENSGASVTSTNTTAISMANSTSTAEAGLIWITNSTTTVPVLIRFSITGRQSGATAPDQTDGGGQYNGSAAISTVTLKTSGGSNWNSGIRITVYARRD